MNEKEKELEELLWQMKLWQREGADAKRITDKIWQELEDIIERYKKETHTNVWVILMKEANNKSNQ